MPCKASQLRTFLASNAERSSLTVPVGVELGPRARETLGKANMNLHPVHMAKSMANVSRFVLYLSVAAALSLATYQPVAANQRDGDGAERNSLTGNWYVPVAAQPGQVALTALQTHFADGNLIEESNSTAIRSLGHGFWKRIGHRRFTQAFLVFRFDASRNFTGHSERLATLELSHDGQTFTYLGGTLNVYDREGNLVSSDITPAGVRGVRFREALPLVP